MRHFFGINVVLFLLTLLGPITSATQKQKNTRPAPSSVTTREITLKVSEGPAHRVKGRIQKDRRTPGVNGGVSQPGDIPLEDPTFRVMIHPREDRLMRGKAFRGDVRDLPQVRPLKFELPEREEPTIIPVPYPGTSSASQPTSSPRPQGVFTRNAPAPSPSNSFEGLDFTTWGAGHPGDTNGDVGPQQVIDPTKTQKPSQAGLEARTKYLKSSLLPGRAFEIMTGRAMKASRPRHYSSSTNISPFGPVSKKCGRT